MIPLWIAQVSTIGMNFMDSAMSGHVSADDLAGVSVGASLFMPILTSSMSVLSAATPMIAQLLGKGDVKEIPRIVRTGLYLSLVIVCLFALGYVCFIDRIMEGLQLTSRVEYIARYYILAMVGAFFFEALVIPLRSLTDTVGTTSISMGLFLLALPVNGLFNYMFIFGKWGAPAMGGIGAGIATLLTYVFCWACSCWWCCEIGNSWAANYFPLGLAMGRIGKNICPLAFPMDSLRLWKPVSLVSSSSF